jgi:hypothetical protein
MHGSKNALESALNGPSCNPTPTPRAVQAPARMPPIFGRFGNTWPTGNNLLQ